MCVVLNVPHSRIISFHFLFSSLYTSIELAHIFRFFRAHLENHMLVIFLAPRTIHHFYSYLTRCGGVGAESTFGLTLSLSFFVKNRFVKFWTEKKKSSVAQLYLCGALRNQEHFRSFLVLEPHRNSNNMLMLSTRLVTTIVCLIEEIIIADRNCDRKILNIELDNFGGIFLILNRFYALLLILRRFGSNCGVYWVLFNEKVKIKLNILMSST